MAITFIHHETVLIRRVSAGELQNMPEHIDSYRTMQGSFGYDVLTHRSILAEGLIGLLATEGCALDRDSSLKLVVDTPQVPALYVLERLKRTAAGAGLTLVVLTFASCAEYWWDLFDLRPAVLLVSPKSSQDVVEGLRRAGEGERYSMMPRHASPLTRSERVVLRSVAEGRSNAEIANLLHMQNQTVMNTLSAIYKKLNVENRAEAILYYWSLPPFSNTAGTGL